MDGTEDKQDVNTSAKGQETSEQTPETFTKEQVESERRRARSDALADINRYKAESEKAMRAAKAAEERVIRMLKEQEDTELDAVRDDPDALKSTKERQRQRVKEAELERRELELNQKAEKYQGLEAKEAERTKEQNARDVAERLGVDTDKLLGLIKFTEGSIEAMEAIAESMPKKIQPSQLKPDSGGTSGGGKVYKREDLLKSIDLKATPQEIHERVLELEKAEEEGRIK